MHRANLSAWSDNAKVGNRMYAGFELHVHCTVEGVPVLRMDQSSDRCKVHGTLSPFDPKNAIGLIRPDNHIRFNVPVPVPQMRDALCFFQPGLALLQVAR